MSCDEPQRANLRQKVEQEKVEREPARPPWRSPPDDLVMENSLGDGEPARGRREAGALLLDWTVVKGSNWDSEKWAREQELRERRNSLMGESH